MVKDETKKRQRIEKLDELADLIIDNLLDIVRSGLITAADRKTILDFLRHNGLNLDPNSVPDDVKGLLTSRISFDDADEAPIRLAK
jgi:hypothetical protein